MTWYMEGPPSLSLFKSTGHFAVLTFLSRSHWTEGNRSRRARTAPGWTMVGWLGGGGPAGDMGEAARGEGKGVAEALPGDGEAWDARRAAVGERSLPGEEGGVGSGVKASCTW